MKSNPKPAENSNGTEVTFDRKKFEEVKSLLLLISKTLSSIKIFSLEHSTVIGVIDDLWDKLSQLLEENWKLELGIEEFSFTFQEKTVYSDDKAIKSLPFLFYKDGMRKLFFYKGLRKEELIDFFKIIKDVYSLPPEESDIVDLLWIKDFANIRYYAPDDFLETKIGVGMEPMELKVDKSEMSSGTIVLDPEDEAELKEYNAVQNVKSLSSDVIKKAEEKLKGLSIPSKMSSLSEKESHFLEDMLQSNRQISAEEELVLLTMEMLSLEERNEQFEVTLDAQAQILKDLIQKGDFSLAAQLLGHATELKETLKSKSDPKTVLIEKVLNNLKSKESLDLVKKTLLERQSIHLNSFFEYLELLGKDVITHFGDVYEEINNPGFRHRTEKILGEIGQHDPVALLDMANDSRPSIACEIIHILSAVLPEQAPKYLTRFQHYQNKSIKSCAIKALGTIQDVSAGKVLLGFLSDKDEDLRILAAQNLHSYQDSSVLDSLKKMVIDKAFKKKSLAEKQALLNVFGRSKTDEASLFLQRLAKRSILFSPFRQMETQLAAVHALGTMKTIEAVKALKKYSSWGNKKIRNAAQKILKEISVESKRISSSNGNTNG